MVIITIARKKTVDAFQERCLYSDIAQTRGEAQLVTHIKFVSIPTRDQYKALAFYTEKLGFKLVTDQPHDDKQRWIEMRVGSSDTHFVLFTMDESRIGGFFPGALACDNVDKTYEELK